MFIHHSESFFHLPFPRPSLFSCTRMRAHTFSVTHAHTHTRHSNHCRRRTAQIAYNAEHGLTPRGTKGSEIKSIFEIFREENSGSDLAESVAWTKERSASNDVAQSIDADVVVDSAGGVGAAGGGADKGVGSADGGRARL